MTAAKLLLFALVASPLAECSLVSTQNAANPIRKVVNMLQLMVKKVEEEGEKEADLYKKFQCYCKTGGATLEKGIAAANIQAPELESSINEAESKKAQIEEDLKSHQSDRQAAKDAIAAANSLREKEAAAFATTKAEADSDIKALKGAITALEKGMSGFLQTNNAQVVKQIIVNRPNMADIDRSDALAFFSAKSSSDYSPQSGQITGILKELLDQTTADLKDATDTENDAIAQHAALVAAKEKEIGALTGSIESKTQRGGELAVDIVEMKDSLSDTEAALLEDKKYLADLESNCASKAGEWEVIQKTRAEELVALHETIKILNDDDALDLFTKTLPKPSSFIQITGGQKDRRARAFSLIQEANTNTPRNPGIDFILLALKGNSRGFEKVIAMVDEMVGTLKQEQVADDNKKEYCNIEFDNTDDKKKGLERKVADTETAIVDTKDAIAKAAEDIESLTAAIKDLDKMVAEATENRKAENAEFTELMSSNTAAKQLLNFAKNRLNKFYNPKLYKPPPARELTEEQRITQNLGGAIEPTAAPGGIAGTGISAFVQIRAHKKDAPAPPPETFGAYSKKGEESTGVIAMVDLLIKDLDKQMTEAETDEENAQKQYEQMMSDSAEKRAADSKSLTDNTANKARLEEEHQGHSESLRSTNSELMATEKYISSLHAECDWLIKYFDARKEARAGEIDSLKNAKAVLSGSDFSLIQSASLRGSRRN